MRLFTIGFTRKSAEDFFSSLQRAEVSEVVDVRLHNTSQLSGFAKQDDLRYFLATIAKVTYRHDLLLAPTDQMLADYRKKRIDWNEYQFHFLQLMHERAIEQRLKPEDLDQSCLLCSEAQPHHCHRRLVAEYLRDQWGDVEIIHLT